MSTRTLPAILAVVSVAAGCSHEKGEPEGEKKEPIQVQAAPVRMATFRKTVKAIGTSSSFPAGLAQVSAALDGIVAEILVSEGDEVKPGQPLVRLDDRLAREAVVREKRSKAEAEAALVLLKAPPREPDRRAAEAEVGRAKIAVDLAREALARLEPLHARKEVSDPQLFEAKQKLEESTLARESAEARRDLLLQGARPEAVAEAEAKLASAESAVSFAEVKLTYSVLSAPRHGFVERILCHPGQALQPGAVAAEIIDPAEVLVTAVVPPSVAAEIRAGQEAAISLERETGSGGPAPLPGKVVSVGRAASAASGSIPVKIAVANPEGRLRSGVVVDVEITVGSPQESLAVPEAAIAPSEEGPSLAIIREGKAAVVHPQVGIRQNGLVQVAAEGLKAGEPAITVGGYNLAEGTAVKAEKAEKK